MSSFSDGQGSPVSQEWGNAGKRSDLLEQIDCSLDADALSISGVKLELSQALAQLYYWAWQQSGYGNVSDTFSITAANAVSLSHFKKLSSTGAGIKTPADKTAPFKQLFDQLGVLACLTKQGSSRWALYLPVSATSKAALLEAGFSIHGVILDDDGLQVLGWTVSAPAGE